MIEYKRPQKRPPEAADRMDAIFVASGDAIFEWVQELIRNYAEANDLSQEETAAAVGKAMLVNGVAAITGIVGDMNELEVADLCDDVMALVAGRLEEHITRDAA